MYKPDKQCPHVKRGEPVAATCETCLGKQVCASCAYNAHVCLRHKVNEI